VKAIDPDYSKGRMRQLSVTPDVLPPCPRGVARTRQVNFHIYVCSSLVFVALVPTVWTRCMGQHSRFSDWLQAGWPRGRSSSPDRAHPASYQMVTGTLYPRVKQQGCVPLISEYWMFNSSLCHSTLSYHYSTTECDEMTLLRAGTADCTWAYFRVLLPLEVCALRKKN
jgi:hypothetical protein